LWSHAPIATYEAAYKDSKGKRHEMLVTADGKEVKE